MRGSKRRWRGGLGERGRGAVEVPGWRYWFNAEAQCGHLTEISCGISHVFTHEAAPSNPGTGTVL